MRPAQVMVGATGPSPWVMVDYMEAGFGVGFRVTVEESATLVYSVQHAFSDMLPVTLANLTRSTTTATATWRVTTENPTHGLAVGDSIFMGGYGAPFDGVFTVATVSSTTVFTYTVANSGPTSGVNFGYITRLHVGTHPLVVGATASMDGNYAFPPNFVRLNATEWTDGTATMNINQGMSSP